MQDIKLTLSLVETNLLLEALGQMPYVRVYELIAKIQQQAQMQLTVQPPEIDARDNGSREEDIHER
jgi:hypothetical protein